MESLNANRRHSTKSALTIRLAMSLNLLVVAALFVGTEGPMAHTGQGDNGRNKPVQQHAPQLTLPSGVWAFPLHRNWREATHMKTTAAVVCAVGLFASSAYAALSNDEVKRLNEAGTILSELRHAPDKGIPEELWTKAQCVVVIPSMKKAAFIVGGEYGSGVMSCRHANEWTAPLFMQLAKGSWGLQIGAEETDLVLLIMNRRGVEKLLEDKVSLGADASVAAGPVGRSGAAATDAQMGAEMLSYSRSQGVFAGIDLSGGVLRPDKEADARAYGANVKAREVALGTARVASLDAATPFLRALRQDVRATTGRK